MDKIQLIPTCKLTARDQQKFQKKLNEAQDQIVPILKELFANFFKVSHLCVYLPTLQAKSPNNICGKLIRSSKKEIVGYKCYDCEVHQDSLLCPSCFLGGNHSGHRTIFYTNVEGICDCGNEQIVGKGSCKEHGMGRGQQQGEQIEKQFDRSKYIRIVQLIFKWIFIIYEWKYVVYAEILMKEIISYLTTRNQIYRQPNQQIFLYSTPPNHTCLLDDLIHLACIYTQQQRTPTFQLLSLFSTIFHGQRLEAALFCTYLRAYDRISNFQKTEYINHMVHLAAKSNVVKQAQQICSNQHSLACRFPKLNFRLSHKKAENLLKYYEVLLVLLQQMEVPAARSFIRSFIDSVIPYPYTHQQFKDQQKDIYQSEKLYYRLLIKVVSLVKQQQSLSRMAHAYLHEHSLESSFRTEVKVTHRVLATILLRMASFDISKLSSNKMVNNKSIFLIFKMTLKHLMSFCLSQSFKKLNFRWGPKRYYTENSIIKYDMLIMKICCILLPEYSEAIENLIVQNIENKAWIKFHLSKFQNDPQFQTKILLYIQIHRINQLLFFAQMAYSPLPQLFFALAQDESSEVELLLEQTLKAIFVRLKIIPESTLLQISSVLFGGELTRQHIQKVADFDSKNKNWMAKVTEGPALNFNLLFSTSTTEIYNLYLEYSVVSNNYFKPNNSPIFNTSIVRRAFEELITSVQSLPDKIGNIKKMIKASKTLSHLYSKKLKEQIELKILSILSQECLTQYWSQDIQMYYPQCFNLLQQPKLEENHDNQQKAKKERQKAKRQALMKNIKMKQSQRYFQIQNIENQYAQPQTQLCLYCKKSDNLCYLASLNITSLLFHRFGAEGQNFVLRTCYHSVHYDCFLDMLKDYVQIPCPLCSEPSNTVIPKEWQNKDNNNEISNYYDYLLSCLNEQQSNLRFDCILSIVYMMVGSHQFKSQLTLQDQFVIKFLYHLILQSKFTTLAQLRRKILNKNRTSIESVRKWMKFFQLFFLILEGKCTSKQYKQFIYLQPYSGEILLSLERILGIELVVAPQKQQTQAQITETQMQNSSQDIKRAEAVLPNSKLSENYLMKFEFPKRLSQFLSVRSQYLMSQFQKPKLYLCLICNESYGSYQQLKRCSDNYKVGFYLDLQHANLIYRNKRDILIGIYSNQSGQLWNIHELPQRYSLKQGLLQQLWRDLINQRQAIFRKFQQK